MCVREMDESELCGKNLPDLIFFHKIHKMFAVDPGIVPGISQIDFVTLITIDKLTREKGCEKTKVSDIVKFLEAPNAAVSRTLRKLEEKDFVVRSVDVEDRRNVYVELTDKSKSVLDESKKNMEEFFGRVISKFGKDKTAQLQQLVHEFSKIWREEIRTINEKKTKK